MKTMKVLQILTSIDGGGVGTQVYNYTVRLMDSFTCDFAVCQKTKGALTETLKQKGANIFEFSPFRAGINKSKNELTNIIKNGQYDIVYVHTGYKAFIPLQVAKKLKVPIRIAHAHTANEPENFSKRAIRKLATFLTKRAATHLVACGETAGEWMWGKNKKEFFVVKNAIDAKKFCFSKELRGKYRKELGLQNESAAVCVARLSAEKNHDFLIDLWKNIIINKPDAKLFLVGDGVLKEQLIQQVKEQKLENNILFLGLREDVEQLLNAFDVFLLPSKHEGFPVSIMEAQANGLPCIVSDNVPKDVIITDIVWQHSLSILNWESAILESFKRENLDRERYADLVKISGYDIEVEAKKYEKELTNKIQR